MKFNYVIDTRKHTHTYTHSCHFLQNKLISVFNINLIVDVIIVAIVVAVTAPLADRSTLTAFMIITIGCCTCCCCCFCRLVTFVISGCMEIYMKSFNYNWIGLCIAVVISIASRVQQKFNWMSSWPFLGLFRDSLKCWPLKCQVDRN